MSHVGMFLDKWRPHANYSAHEGPLFFLVGFAKAYLSFGPASERFNNLIFTITAPPLKRIETK